MKKILMLLLAVPLSVSAFTEVEKAEIKLIIVEALKAEAKQTLIDIVKEYLINNEVKISRIVLTRPTGSFLFRTPHTQQADGTWVSSANSTTVFKPQVGAHDVWMSGDGTTGVNKSVGWITHTQGGVAKRDLFELNGKYDFPVGIVINPRNVSSTTGRASWSLTTEGDKLVARNEYLGHSVYAFLSWLGWANGAP